MGTSEDSRIEAEVAHLYNKHARELLRYAFVYLKNREAAEDAVQESFLKYYVCIISGQNIESPRAWLFRVLRNHALDQIKSVKTTVDEVVIETPGALTKIIGEPTPELHCQRNQILKQIADRLSARELACLRLRCEGLSYREIADALEVRLGTVAGMLSRVHKKMSDIRRTNESRCRKFRFVEPNALT